MAQRLSLLPLVSKGSVLTHHPYVFHYLAASMSLSRDKMYSEKEQIHPLSQYQVHGVSYCICIILLLLINLIGEINHFVDVDIMQAMDRIVCTFHDQQSGVQEKACRIVYGPMGSNCRTMGQSSHSFSDSVIVGLPLEDIEQEYCFSVTASSGPFTTIVEGIFLKGIAN